LRNSREKKSKIEKKLFYTFGILTTKMTTKMYTKLASIEINDASMKYYQKWAEYGKIWGKTFLNVNNEVKIQKLLKISFLEFLEFLEINFSRNSRK
jgi:hypothetical protein